MVIYPDIELMGGTCVNLHRGHMEEPIAYDIKPLDAAREFVSQGAEILHIVDLDAVMQRGNNNAGIIGEIIQNVAVPVQVGGGLRTASSVDWWLEHGAERVVVGSAAVTDKNFLHDICQRHPGRVVASIDTRDDRVMVHGWKEQTAFTPLEVGQALENSGISAIIYTDIDMDIDVPEATLAATTTMATELNIPVISSGTVKSLDDISRLQLLPNIAGAITGRALFGKWLSLPDALAISRQPQSQAKLI